MIESRRGRKKMGGSGYPNPIYDREYNKPEVHPEVHHTKAKRKVLHEAGSAVTTGQARPAT